jgi:hypothetical protein
MRSHDIERALREDTTIEPSADFASRVMREVRREAHDAGAIGFPWSRVVPGLVVSLILVAVAVAFAPEASEPTRWAETLMRVIEGVPTETAAWTLAPLAASWILVRFSLRLAGYRS